MRRGRPGWRGAGTSPGAARSCAASGCGEGRHQPREQKSIEESSPSTIVVKSKQNRNEIKVRSYDNPSGILGLPRKLQQLKFLCILESKRQLKSNQSQPKSSPNPSKMKPNPVKAKPNPGKIIVKQSRMDESRCSYEPYTSLQAQY